MEYLHVSHRDLKPFVMGDPHVLILGSFPSVASRKENFYYAHKQNRFFPTISGLFSSPIPITIEEKKKLLSENHIALYDVIYECDIVGSSDSSIKNVVSAKEEINKIKKDYSIKAVFTLGRTSFNLYRKYIGEDNIYLPSTSPLNARMSLDDLIKEFAIIKKYL